ncbi:MAG: metal ABC transporter substrate-binding protein [Firmicutes bacterium]|nr:metal ABC transporter substrate-binding protein [Bacillota bacterium]
MKISRFTALAVLLLAVMLLAGCSKSKGAFHAGTSEKEIGKLKVVTTFAPLYSFAVNVAGDAAVVENLVPIGASIHSFQAKPSDIKKIARADVLIINGVGLEEFLDDIVRGAANPGLTIVDTSKSIKVLESHDKDEHQDGDPHIWLSPENAVKQVEAIRDALIKADPKNAKSYSKNAEAYIERLKRLDVDIAKELASAKKEKYFVFHNAYQYFEKQYGIRNSGSIEEFPGKEPSPRQMARIIDYIKDHGARIVFTEPQFSPKVIDVLRQDYGIYTGVLDPIGQELSRDGYEKNMRRNLSSLMKAFKEVKDDGL